MPPGNDASIDRAELEALWWRARPTVVAGVPVEVCSPTDLLLHLCMHMSIKHRFEDTGLSSCVDVAEVCRRYGGEIDFLAGILDFRA